MTPPLSEPLQVMGLPPDVPLQVMLPGTRVVSAGRVSVMTTVLAVAAPVLCQLMA